MTIFQGLPPSPPVLLFESVIMPRLTDFTETDRPTQTLIVKLLAEGLPASQNASGDVTLRYPDHVIRITGRDLTVSEGTITSGTITGLQVENSLFNPLTPLQDGSAPFAYDPRIGTIDGLDLSARAFNALLDKAGHGAPAPLKSALTGDGLTYQDSHYDNAAKGGRHDDLFLDLNGNDSYKGGRGIDTLSYEFSHLDDFVFEYQPGARPVGITADLRDGTVQSFGHLPPLTLAPQAPMSFPGDAIPHTDTIRNIENITGSGFDDLIRGDAGTNILRGLAGDDHLRGRQGDDRLDGGAGDDKLLGNRGNDTIRSGDGRDVIIGGGGEDTFVFDLFEDGTNVIRDFAPLRDEIELSLLGFDLSIDQVGADVIIRHTDDQPWVPVPEEDLSSLTVILRDTQLDDLMMGENLSIFYAQY